MRNCNLMIPVNIHLAALGTTLCFHDGTASSGEGDRGDTLATSESAVKWDGITTVDGRLSQRSSPCIPKISATRYNDSCQNYHAFYCSTQQMNPRNELWTKRKKEETTQKRWKSQQYRWKMTEGNKEVWRQKKQTNQDKKEGKKAKRMREQGKESEKKGRNWKETQKKEKGTKQRMRQRKHKAMWLEYILILVLRHFVFSHLNHT